ncbi:MAG: ABC transporter ATP-binding protein, partial [Burkholderiales bacterium]
MNILLGRAPRKFRTILQSEVKRMRWRIALAAFGLAGVTAAELAAPWPLKVVVDHILLAQTLPGHLAWLEGLFAMGINSALVAISASIAVIALAAGAFSYLQIYHSSRIGHELVHALRLQLFSHLQRLSLSYHFRAKGGEMLTRITSDTTLIRDLIADWLLNFAARILMVTGVLVIMFFLDWRLATGVFFTLPLLFCAMFLLNRKIRVAARSQRKQEGRLASRINEMLSSISLVQAFGRESYQDAGFAIDSGQSLEAGIINARVTASVSKSVALVAAIGTAGTVMAGAWLVLRGALTPGELLIFVAYVGSLYRPLRDLGKLSVKFSRAMASVERIEEILAREPDIVDLPGATEVPALRGDIAFENVTYAYDRASPVLRDVSFHIGAGQSVAIVGASGAGKSTILSLLLRLFDPQSGQILFDGLEIRQFRRDSLRTKIGVVLQDTLLFGSSIADNIAYGRPDASIAQIEDAARLAQAHDFIAALPDAYDTVLGERGLGLSGGQ